MQCDFVEFISCIHPCIHLWVEYINNLYSLIFCIHPSVVYISCIHQSVQSVVYINWLYTSKFTIKYQLLNSIKHNNISAHNEVYEKYLFHKHMKIRE